VLNPLRSEDDAFRLVLAAIVVALLIAALVVLVRSL
jgi:hypothetical protein